MNNILIGLHTFEGPMSGGRLRNAAGICAILHQQNNEYELVDLIHSDNLKRSWEYRQWQYNNNSADYPGTIVVATLYLDNLSRSERQRIIDEIEQDFDMAETALAS